MEAICSMIEDIRIECDDSSHEGRVVKVARMVHDARGWTDMGSVTTQARREAEGEAKTKGKRSVSPQRSTTGYRPTDDGHEKFNWECELCRAKVRVRAENAAPILDTLAAADVNSISLSGFAARLHKQ